jgi:hypothetical protein
MSDVERVKEAIKALGLPEKIEIDNIKAFKLYSAVEKIVRDFIEMEHPTVFEIDAALLAVCRTVWVEAYEKMAEGRDRP